MRLGILPVFILLLATGFPPTAASAADVAERDHLNYLTRTVRPIEAAELAAALIEEDPTDLEAHWYYIQNWATRMHEWGVIEQQYRAWYEEDPDDEVRRVAYAQTLFNSRSRQGEGPWCQEVEELLSTVHEDPVARYRAIRVRMNIHRRLCPGDTDADNEDMIQLGKEVDAARGYALFLRMGQEPVDDELARELRSMTRQRPFRLAYLWTLWNDDTTGTAVERARKDALKAATAAMKKPEPAVVYAARSVFRAADDDEKFEAAEARLEALDPNWRSGKKGMLEREFRDATRKANKQLALDNLLALEEQVPAEGELRAKYHRTRASLLDSLEREDEAYQARREAYQAFPDDAAAANAFAWKAALRGEDLELALQAIDGAIDQHGATEYEHTPRGWSPDYEPWLEKKGTTLAAYLDTRGWLLYRLERFDEAAASLREALLHNQNAELFMHMGLIYAALGRDDEALEYLLMSLSSGAVEDEEAVAAARAKTEELFPTRPYWCPDGLDGYLALRTLAAEAAKAAEEGAEKSENPPTHALVGQPFPSISFDVDGEAKTIADYPGIRIVDMWATWCGPCRQALDHIQELAEARQEAGVTVLALSVDSKQKTLHEFFEDAEEVKYTVGWAGKGAMKDLDIYGIPVTFIVDAEGLVTAYISGYGNGDTRIDEALDALLAR